jgi:CHAD domain-containing protein
VKARSVKGLDPERTLADNAQKIISVRLDEMCSFMPKAADPAEVVALHDMRIAAKRLRYILELTHPCFGPYAKNAVKMTKDVQDLLGELHDCDVQIPEVRAFLDELAAADAAVVGPEAAGLKRAPNRGAYAGLVALQVHLHARRTALFEDFLELWQDYERKGYRARLEFAITERSQDGHGDAATIPVPDAIISGEDG